MTRSDRSGRRDQSRERPRERRGGRRGYHHGDLSQAMVRAALKLIDEFGPSGFTFAEVTRVVGVSPAAPYRHFRDRDALIAHIAVEGFEKLTDQLFKAWKEGEPNPLEAYQALGRAYLQFAKEEPAYYAAMFETHFPDDLNREVRKASDEAFAALRTATEALLEALPDTKDGKKPPVLMVSLHVWSLTHGIVSLYGSGPNARHTIPMDAQDLLEAGLLVYLEGLGISL